MKSSPFTENQRTMLQQLLFERLKSYDQPNNEKSNTANFKRFYRYYVEPTRSALDKLAYAGPDNYNDKEKLCCISCVNEHYDHTLDRLKIKTALDWINISEDQRKTIAILDDCKDILNDCGYFSSQKTPPKLVPDFRYGAILKVFDKLKRSDLIFLSKTVQNEYYKIAFVHNNEEYLSFELSQKISWRNLAFISFGGTPVEEIAKARFSFMCTKVEARELLSVFKPKYYFEETKDTVNFLLN